MGDTTAEGLAPLTRPGARPSPVVYAALVVQVLIAAATYLVAKRSLQEIPPLAVLVCRFALSGLLFWLILFVVPGPVLPPRQAWKKVLLLGFVGGPLNQGLFLWGLSRSTAAHAALFYALTPLAVYLYALWRRQEVSSPRKLVGIAIAFTGVLILLLGRGLRAAVGPMIGDLFILGGVAAWAIYTAEGKTFTAEHGAIRATAWTMIAASLWILPCAPFVVVPNQLLAASATALAGIVFLAVVTSVISYLLWYFALSRLDASRVAIFANLQPVATALAAWWLLGDPLNWEMAVGGILVLVGVRVTQAD